MRNLSKTQWEQIISVLLSAVLAVAAVLGWVITPVPVDVQVVALEGQAGGDIPVGEVSDMAYSLTGYGADFDDVSAASVTVSGAVNVGTTLDMAEQTALTVTDGAAFAPTGTFQAIQAASNVTPTITVSDAGDVVVVTNVSTYTITIADTGTAKLGGTRALGQYDTLVLMSDGTNWLELSFTNN